MGALSLIFLPCNARTFNSFPYMDWLIFFVCRSALGTSLQATGSASLLSALHPGKFPGCFGPLNLCAEIFCNGLSR